MGGWGVMSSLNLHAWLMLRNRGWGGGVGRNVILELARMVDATEQGLGWTCRCFKDVVAPAGASRT